MEVMKGLDAALQNRMLLQFLSTMGHDIGTGGNRKGFPSTNAAIQQNIQAQSMHGLLQKLLSGGGKITMDAENVNIKAPSKAFQNPGADPGQTRLDYNSPTQFKGAGDLPKLNMPKQSGGMGADGMLAQLLMGNTNVNPSASPLDSITPSDLAGLTTQDISQALQFKFAQDEQGRRQINDVFNNMYKMSLIKQGEAQTQIARSKELRAIEEMFRSAPLAVPGLGRVTEDQWEQLPADIKAYSYYAFDAQNNNEEVLSFNEFKTQSDPSSLIEYYELAKTDKEFKKFYFESKKAGAAQINVGEKVKETAIAKGQTYFKGNWANDVEKHINSEDVQNKMMKFEPGERATKVAAERIKFIERQMTSRGAQITDVYWEDDGTTMSWKIKWPNGETETVSYGIRD